MAGTSKTNEPMGVSASTKEELGLIEDKGERRSLLTAIRNLNYTVPVLLVVFGSWLLGVGASAWTETIFSDAGSHIAQSAFLYALPLIGVVLIGVAVERASKLETRLEPLRAREVMPPSKVVAIGAYSKSMVWAFPVTIGFHIRRQSLQYFAVIIPEDTGNYEVNQPKDVLLMLCALDDVVKTTPGFPHCIETFICCTSDFYRRLTEAKLENRQESESNSMDSLKYIRCQVFESISDPEDALGPFSVTNDLIEYYTKSKMGPGLKEGHIVVDITGGTKHVSIGMLLASLDERIDIQYGPGKREESGSMKTQGPFLYEYDYARLHVKQD